MRILKKLCSIMVIVCMSISFAVPYCGFAASVWDGFAMAGAVDKGDGTVVITATGGNVSSVAKMQSVALNYTLRVKVKVDQFSGETGMQISNGAYRLMTYFKKDGISVGGGSSFGYNIGNEWHTYTFEVKGGTAEIYIDDVYMGDSAVQSNTLAGRLYFWVKNTGSESAIMQISNLEYAETIEQIVSISGEPTEKFYQDWSDKGSWQLSSPNVKIVDGVETGKDVHLNSTMNRVVSSALLYYVPADSFIFRFRIKVNKYNGETGAKVEYGPYRTFCYFSENNISLRTNEGNIIIEKEVGYDWHEYALKVENGYATFLMDNAQLASYNIEPYIPKAPVMSFWVKPSGGESDMTVDWVEYTPFLYNLNMTPLNGSEFVQGEDVSLKCTYTGDDAPEYVEYRANGTVIGRGDAPEYEFIWKNAPYGNYEIAASYGEDVISPKAALYIRRNFGGVISAKNQFSADEKVFLYTDTFHRTEGKSVESVKYIIQNKTYEVKNKDEKFKFDLGNLPIGTYKVKAILIDTDGNAEETTEKNIVVTANQVEGTVVPLEYELEYKSERAGRITACDGTFLLDIEHTPNEIVCLTNKGKITVPLTAGNYGISVKSGAVEITRNGALEKSFVMPREDEIIPLTSSGLNSIKVNTRPEREILIRRNGDFSELITSNYDSWSLEFEKDNTDTEIIEYNDGAYYLKLTINDKITAVTTPVRDGEKVDDVLYSVTSGRHLYRVTSTRGIAQLFVDGVYAASMRLTPSEAETYINRSGNKNNNITILRAEKDKWTFYEDFEGTKTIASEEYWTGDGKRSIGIENGEKFLLISDGSSLLNGFLKETELYAKARISRGGKTGAVWVNLRKNSDHAYIKAGYNFVSQCWEIYKIFKDSEELIASRKGTIPTDEWFGLGAILNEEKLSVTVNGNVVVSTDAVQYISHGRVGFEVESRTIKLNEIRVTGDGRIAAGVDEQVYYDAASITFLELKDGRLLKIGWSTSAPVMQSFDNGKTFSPVDIPELDVNSIRLSNGNILSIKRIPGPEADTYWDEAYISEDECETFKGPYRIETRVSNRITMNAKIYQTKNGRILFCAGESGSGMEDEGAMAIYYSDDGGVTWNESETPLTIWSTGVNCQEGEVVELPDGTLRCYMRADRGFVYMSDSYDGGVTWSMDLKPSQLPASMNAFNIERDIYEEETYYIVWEYDNPNEYNVAQLPRCRAALAVSYDGCKTWEFVCDLNSYDLRNSTLWRHGDHGIYISKDYIFASADMWITTATSDSTAVNYVWKIDKDMIRSQKRFPLLYDGRRLMMDNDGTDTENIDFMYIQSKSGNDALIFGEYETVKATGGNLISAKAVASYLGTVVKEENDEIKLTVDKIEAIFKEGSTDVFVNGVVYTSQDVCSGIDGIQADAVARAFGKDLYTNDNYVILTSDWEWKSGILKNIEALLTKRGD